MTDTTKRRIEKRKLVPGAGYAKPLDEKHKAKPPSEDSVGIQNADKPWLFQPGQPGNPKGRPKGARSKFSEALVQAFAQDFEQHGAEVIQAVREEKPQDYLKIAASLVPKQMEIEAEFTGLTHEERVAERERLITEYEATRGPEAIN